MLRLRRRWYAISRHLGVHGWKHGSWQHWANYTLRGQWRPGISRAVPAPWQNPGGTR